MLSLHDVQLPAPNATLDLGPLAVGRLGQSTASDRSLSSSGKEPMDYDMSAGAAPFSVDKTPTICSDPRPSPSSDG